MSASFQGNTSEEFRGQASFVKVPGNAPRRSSSRSIKRKKFDDELVDTSNPFSKKVAPERRTSESRRSSESSQPEQKPLKKSTSRQSSSKKKSKRVRPQPVAADFGRWRPMDDLALITAVQQTNDLNLVHLGVKFSCNFTLKEIQERWYSLLYDPVVSRLAQNAMKSLPADVIQAIQNSALWSKDEEQLLAEIPSNSNPTVDKFEKILEEHHEVFHKSRTSKALMNHWVLLRHYQLLLDQNIRSHDGDVTLNDIEAKVNDDELREIPRDEILDQELSLSDRRQKREIKRLETEVPKWQVLVDDLTGSGAAPSEFDPQTLAVLRGRVVRYLMRSKEITFGRSASDTRVDIDFSLEGPTWKISRRQGIIKLASDGSFLLFNQGRRPVFINGKSVVSGAQHQLQHNSTLEICGLKFLFLINPELSKLLDNKLEATAKRDIKLPEKT